MGWIKSPISLIVILIFCCNIVLGANISEKENINPLEYAKSLYTVGDYNLSFDVIESYILQYPNNSSGWNLKGLILLNNKSYDLAINSFQNALNNSPGDPRIMYNLGLTEMYMGNLESASDFFNQSLMNNPQDVDVHFYLGLVKYGLGQYTDSVVLFKFVTDSRPIDVNAWFNLGMAYEKIQRLDLAIKAYEEATNIDPSYSKPWFSIGKIYTILGNSSEALTPLEKYTQLEPNDSEGWFWYSTNLKKTNQVNESIETLNKAISLDPDNQEYQRYLPMYSGDYSNTIVEYIFTPLSSFFLWRMFVLLCFLTLISIWRYKPDSF